MKRLIEAHKFFIRVSPLYVMGDHIEYLSAEKLFEYRLRFPRAYIRFMWFYVKDIIMPRRDSHL